jgi:hypothetical protein
MAELTAADVEQYTQGRLVQGDAETIRLLAERLAAARRYCGWHVTPIREDDELTLDGPGGWLLRLPTLRLVELVEVTENGVAIDVDDLYVSPLGMATKKSGACWAGNLGAITVTMTHGFDAAPDFDGAVLSSIDRSSFVSSGGRPRVVGPFQYETDGTDSECAILDLYRIEQTP